VGEEQVNIVPFFDLGRTIRAESKELHEALDRVIDSGFFIGGPSVERFEQQFATYVGSKHCIGVANGLDAIRLILEAYEIGPGDEVIVPAFTYYATWLAVIQTGATLVPVDVIANTANIDPNLVEEAINPKTKAIIAVHLFGQGADMLPLTELAKKHGIYLFEDAAQGHGAETTAGRVGSSSDAAAFSFYPTKNLGALGDAGAVTTDDPAIASRIVSRRSYGQGNSKYEHVDTGWNSRLDPLQAEFLSIHLSKLDSWTEKRRDIAARYVEALGEDRFSSIIGPHSPRESVWHHFILKSSDRQLLRTYLSERGITTDVHYPYSIKEVSPLGSFVSERKSTDDFVARKLGNQVLSLPIGPWLEDSEISQVCEALTKIPDNNLVSP
jgi:dTDP-3-amino-3,4,6-trideoxy-alpha-D-glucose transaminase